MEYSIGLYRVNLNFIPLFQSGSGHKPPVKRHGSCKLETDFLKVILANNIGATCLHFAVIFKQLFLSFWAFIISRQ